MQGVDDGPVRQIAEILLVERAAMIVGPLEGGVKPIPSPEAQGDPAA